MEKEISIVDNKDLLDSSDFADWDEGRLSTNKAFQKMKERQKQIETENAKLRKALSESEAKRKNPNARKNPKLKLFQKWATHVTVHRFFFRGEIEG